MPYYSDPTLYSTPISSYSLYLSGPYSSHSSLIASRSARPSSTYVKPLSRFHRAYAPHLATITENQVNSALRRKYSPHIPYSQSSAKYKVPRPIKINTADIDVSADRYKSSHTTTRSRVQDYRKENTSKSPSPGKSDDTEEFVPKPIRRDRPTVRLHTLHKDNESKKESESKTDKAEEEIVVKPIRRDRPTVRLHTRHKDNDNKLNGNESEGIQTPLKDDQQDETKLDQTEDESRNHGGIKKNPSFHDICTAISVDKIDNELNPGQPESVKRKQCRTLSNEDFFKEVRQNSADILKENVNVLDHLLEHEKLNKNQVTSEQSVASGKEDDKFDPRGSVKRKKKLIKKKTNEISVSDDEGVAEKDTVQRRAVKKIKRNSTDSSIHNKSAENFDPESLIKDISKVEVEEIRTKPKPVISATVEIGETKKKTPNLKLVIDDVRVEEVQSPKLPKKFKLNVTVDVETEKSVKSETMKKDKYKIKKDDQGKVHIPQTKDALVTEVKKHPQRASLGDIYEGMEKIPSKKTESTKMVNGDASGKDCGSNKSELLPVEHAQVVDNFWNSTDDKDNITKNVSLITNSDADGAAIKDDNFVENENDFGKKPEDKQAEITEGLVKKDDKEDKTPPPKQNQLQEKLNQFNKTKAETRNDTSNITDKLKKLEQPKEKQASITQNKTVLNRIENTNLKSPVEEKISPKRPQTLELDQKNIPNSPKEKKPVLQLKIFEGDSPKQNEKPAFKIPIKSKKDLNSPEIKPSLPPKEENASTENFWDIIGSRESVYSQPSAVFKRNAVYIEAPKENQENKKEEIEDMVIQKNKINENQVPIKEDAVTVAENEPDDIKPAQNQKVESEEIPKKIISKAPPTPEPQTPETPKTGFTPLQSNRLSQWMHPWKKPEQFDECPVEIFARPKPIKGRHIPKPRHPIPLPQPQQTDNSESEEESSAEGTDSSEEVTTTDDEANVGKSTSSNDSGFNSSTNGSSTMQENKNKGSLDSRDSPTSNPAHNPAFALDPTDTFEEFYTSSTYAGFQKSGRITPPATTIPRFRKYCVEDFNFLKVLGKGSFGKVLLAELKDTEYYYAIKCLKKDVVLEDDDVECTLIERKVLALGTKHPYLCHLLCTFQTESHLFFVMEYLNGGDLMFHIQMSGRFPEPRACIYGAEIVSGLKFLHTKGIVYRDLKLDNILLDFDGHVRIADFGMCKLQIFLDRMADTFCGTPDYMAPEIIKGLHYNQCVDWWSFGVLLYEMLIGQSPFSGCDEDELFWSICNEKPVFPRFLSTEATSILKQLLEKDANKRLGYKMSPHGEIQDHAFFRPISWDLLERRQMDAPFKPNLQHPLDTQYFDKTFTVEKAKLTPIDKNILQSMDQAQFQGFSYTNPNATDRYVVNETKPLVQALFKKLLLLHFKHEKLLSSVGFTKSVDDNANGLRNEGDLSDESHTSASKRTNRIGIV
ncbi:Protein kinase C terminal domain [Popillia japonica]|uniref:protein kinase C n=1 Tax=Popillia japonica TaxID=7064 RepID=A0AAW1LFK8_POPJA